MKLFKKEKEVVELAMEYLATVVDCVNQSKEAVIASLHGDRETLARLHPHVSELESKADEVRRSVEDKLFSGAYLPLMRGDIYGVLESLDAIPNAAESCCRFFFGEKPEIPAGLKEQFLRVTAESFDIIEELNTVTKKFFKPKGKIEEIREHAKKVGEQESVVDRLEGELTLAIFGSQDLELAHKMHMKEALAHIVQLPDRAEDAAESLVLVAMKSIL